jgi:hypothetical protein
MTSRPILPTPLVSTDWLANHLGDPDLRVLDATAHLTGPESGSTVGWSLRRGLNDYLAAHIPGAAFADIIDDLSEPDGGALSKPSPARFAVPAGRLNIGPVSRVVVYALDVHWATRVWWLSCPPRHQPVVFEHVDPMLRVKRSRASAPHRREPPGTGDALRMKSGHESETTRAGHNVRRVASVQFSAPHVDIRFAKLQQMLLMR